MELRIGGLVRIRRDLRQYGVYSQNGDSYFVAPQIYECRGREFVVSEIVELNVCKLVGFASNLYFPVNMFSHVDGEEIIYDEEDLAHCPICGNPMEEGQAVCDDCEEQARRIIGSYHSFNKDNYIARGIANETGAESTTIGAELEVEIGNDNRRSITALLCKKKDTNDIIHFENDGSLSNGFEIITQPMTFKYWQEMYANDLAEILKTAQEHGGKSHDTTTCGLHLHVGKNCLATLSRSEDDVIDNILLIVETFRKEIEKFARRQSNRYARYLTDIDANDLNMDVIKELKSNNSSDKYIVVNLKHSNTIEFRMFRGTLKFETFMATVELVNNIVNIAKYEDIQGMSWNDIISYNSEMNKYLTQYNETLNISSSKTINVLSFYETNKELFSLQNLIDGNFEVRLNSSNYQNFVAFGMLLQALKDEGCSIFSEGSNLKKLAQRMNCYDYLSVDDERNVVIYDGARFRGNGSAKKKIELLKLVNLYSKYSELLED